PQGLQEGRARRLEDEGLLYSFDPAACLHVEIELAAHAAGEVLFIEGHAADEFAAARLIAKYALLEAPSEAALRGVLERVRKLDPLPALPASTWPFAFSDTGAEVGLTQRTPRPWAHPLANPVGYGVIVSNEGEIHSFAGNERQNALTPYRFESVAASLPGQLVYVVDLESGEVDTPGFVPFRRADVEHRVLYGLGAVTLHKIRGQTELELTVFVLPDAPADVRLLTVRNHADVARRFRVVPYLDIVLDESPAESRGHIEVVRDEATETLLYANWGNDFRKGVAFAATSLNGAASETVRTRFVGGRGRDLTNPYMVETGMADPSRKDDGRRVAAFSGLVEVPPHGQAEVVVVLGQMPTHGDAIVTAGRLRDPATARSELQATRAWWGERLSAVQVETNDPAFDRMVNHWLPYQVLASRLWGRTGPNQRGGAFGFRDQLQDVLPLVFFDATLARQQIVLHASQQFLEGDVLKWWHTAPDGRTGLGQRTRASDPHLWLPYVLARYVAATGDMSVLDERVAYLEGPPVPEGTDTFVFAPRPSREIGSVYQHCIRAIEYTLQRMGGHGLPLLGAGDWNDGLDLAGFRGRGESVWLAFFLHDILTRFSAIVRVKEGDSAAHRYLGEAERLAQASESAWMGDHYALVFHDSGVPLDPASAMTSAWPALSGAVDFQRGLAALEQGLAHLEKENRILLLTPPYDENSRPYPGRIADYPPGVRENGGQYSHGASWAVDAYMHLSDMARGQGDPALAARLAARAFTCWRKISPLGKTEGDELAVYGIAPHQQPADIYDGFGHGGRGGWSWYTGSAARMLSAAYAVLGINMENGAMIVPDTLFEPKGELVVKTLRLKEQTHSAPEDVGNAGLQSRFA
ncbi:MAG: glycosyl transferase family 36, partial [Methylobacteriaceae bacterium]|nr:glycosyl transferase family 36 [Methylobacteriaceae bacterium]